jgi:Protein of unknown function (DUF1091)
MQRFDLKTGLSLAVFSKSWFLYPQGSILVEYKSYRNWRHIFKSPEFDLCLILSASNNIPFVKDILESFRSVHPFIPTSCPIQPRAEYYLNIPVHNLNEGSLNSQGGIVPNGLYRFRILANTKDDPKGGYIEWILEVKRQFNFGEW